MNTTPEQREEAKLHATAWVDAWGYLRATAEHLRSDGHDPTQVKIIAVLAMAVSDGYRKIANGKDLED